MYPYMLCVDPQVMVVLHTFFLDYQIHSFPGMYGGVVHVLHVYDLLNGTVGLRGDTSLVDPKSDCTRRPISTSGK